MSSPLKQLIRYETQLKATSQRIEIMLLQSNPTNFNILRQLIQEQQQLLKYLEVESTKLQPESKQIYTRNLIRYKKKAKEHREYIGINHGLLPKTQQDVFMDYQRQNAVLAQNKLTMYENQRVQEGMNQELHYQGEKIYGGVQRNKNMQRQVDHSEGAIKLIQRSILKRKIMFGSLLVFFGLALIFAIVMKIKRRN